MHILRWNSRLFRAGAKQGAQLENGPTVDTNGHRLVNAENCGDLLKRQILDVVKRKNLPLALFELA